jgi:diguanylate cyclase (GGDEF)-like protein/PAS domain S-box-containing protein
LISIEYIISDVYKRQAIAQQLQQNVKELEKNYQIILHNYKINADSLSDTLLHTPEIIHILEASTDANETEKNLLRTQLYALVKNEFLSHKSIGVNLILFTQPDNTVFLRMHKPSIFSDDIAHIRLAIAKVNQEHKKLSGFEQGKISHAFRHIYPIFNETGMYLGSLDISFSSERMQQTLEEVHELHTHFLINKDILDSRIWQVKDVTAPYTQSLEHSNYMIYNNAVDYKHIKPEISEHIIQKNRALIDSRIAKAAKFAIYGCDGNTEAIVIVFFPLKSILEHDHADAYMVSYISDPHILDILNDYQTQKIVGAIIAFLLLLLLYVMYTQRIAVQKEKERYRNLIHLASDGIFILDFDAKLIEYNQEAKNLLGYSDEEMQNLYIFDWDIQLSKKEILDGLASVGAEPISIETKHQRKDGSSYDAFISIVKITLGDKDYVYTSVRDITQQKERDKELQEKLQKFIDTQDSIVVLSDGKKLLFANKKFYNFFGYESLDEFVKKHQCICHRFVEQEMFFHLGKVKADEKNWIESLMHLSGRQRVVSMQNSESIPHAFTVSINSYNNDTYVVSFSDISDTMLEKLQLERKATVDALTGTYNRVYFNQNIKHLLTRNAKDHFQTGIIFFDIDHFKNINDTYGHDTGDEILKQIVTLVKSKIRESDKLIRWGGEEFIVITKTESLENVCKNAENLRSAIEQYDFKAVTKMTCSFGCSLHDESTDINDTIKIADEALYKAKNSGRNRVEIL